MFTAVATQARGLERRTLLTSLLSFPALLIAAQVLSVYLFVSPNMADPDIWWHLRDAQLQLQTHAFLHADAYSYTAHGNPWMNHEWLAELPFYLGWHLAGARGLFLVTVGAVECIFLGVFYLAWRHSRDYKAALLATLLAAFLSTVSFGPRTLLFGWICLVGELLILQPYAEDLLSPDTRRAFSGQSGPPRRLAWLLPPLFAIWVNTHGSWLIGVVVLILFVASGWLSATRGALASNRWSRAQRRQWMIVTPAIAAALLINPYGWRLVAYPFDLAFRQKLNIANVEEWASLDFHSPRGHILLLCLTLVFVSQLVRRRSWALYELAYLALGVYSAFTYSRFLFLAAILLFPIFAKELAGLSPYRAEKNKPLLNAAILCLLVIPAVRHFPAGRQQLEPGHYDFPEKALPFLRAFHPEGRVFNEFLWGGYLEWHAPQIPVLIDSRVDIFEYRGVLKDYLDAMRLKDSLAILDKYRIRYVLFPADAPLTYLLKHTSGWKIDYQDDSTILLERATWESPQPELSGKLPAAVPGANVP